jgi:O-antigen ligase
MLCNYLTVSLVMLLVARHLGWVGSVVFHLLLAAIGVTALFTLTPGLGGFLLAGALWIYLMLQVRWRGFAYAALVSGGAAAVLFVLAAAVTPIVQPTAPFLIHLPGIDQQFAPAVRMMTWMEAWQRFLQNPLIGTGIGTDAATVRYIDPSGILHVLTDAHNVFLNFAVQCGLLGLAAMVLLMARVASMTGALALEDGNAVRLGLGLAWLSAFAYQGLTGSYEDARHLWVLLGLLLASVRLERRE